MSDDAEPARVQMNGPGGGAGGGAATLAPVDHFEEYCLAEDADGNWHEMPMDGNTATVPAWARRIKAGARPRPEYRHLYGETPPTIEFP